MKNITSLFLALPIGIVAIIVFFLVAMWPHAAPIGASADSPTSTKQIDHQQSVGGVVADATADDGKRAAPSAPKPSSNTDNAVSRAPKQHEIAATINTEYKYRALGVSNDPLTQASWVLNATKTHAAWDSTTGNGTVVAVIDTGFALSHEDLTEAWMMNDQEMGTTSPGDTCWDGVAADKATNGCDDDGNGYVDDYRGWDFVSANNSPQAGESNPSGEAVSHGTEVAGLVGAVGNNGVGVATVAWNNRVMPLQALDDDGTGYTSDVVAAVYYAVDSGADVINMSLGGTANDPALATAISYAYANDVVVVAAAGNCGTGQEYGCNPSQPGQMGYPALNRHVLSVGATTSSNTRASFSSYGAGLDVVAPGSGSLKSPMWTASNDTSAYAANLYGTSFASPIVASYVGLLKAIRPASSVDDITALVDATAQKVPNMNGDSFTGHYGHGLIDAESGLRVATNLATPSSTLPTLQQTGSVRSEHTFKNNMALSSGCQLDATTYCTVWAQDQHGYDRYLPYTLSNASGETGWQWQATVLNDGLWQLRVRSGDMISAQPYALSRK